MNKIIPIANIVVSIVAFTLSIIAVVLAALCDLFALLAVFAIVFTVIGFSASVINCGFAFAFTKSKLCITAGVISAISLIICIAAYIIML